MKRTVGGAFVVAVLLVGAAMALAQAEPQPKTAVPGQRPAQAGLMALMAADAVQAEVTSVDEGVAVRLTPKDPARLGALHERVERAVAVMQKAREAAQARMKEKGKDVEEARWADRGLLGLVVSGQVNVSAKKTDDGVILRFTSKDGETVKVLQQNMPKWLEQARGAGKAAAGVQRRAAEARKAPALLAKDQVALEVKETDKGVAVTVTSDDPELAKQIKETLPAYFKAQKALARRAQDRRAGVGWQSGAMPRYGMPGAQPRAWQRWNAIGRRMPGAAAGPRWGVAPWRGMGQWGPGGWQGWGPMGPWGMPGAGIGPWQQGWQ